MGPGLSWKGLNGRVKKKSGERGEASLQRKSAKTREERQNEGGDLTMRWTGSTRATKKTELISRKRRKKFPF